MSLTPVESSNVRAVGWDESALAMIVEFKDGSRYKYNGVDSATVDEIISAPSVGRALRRFRGHRVRE